MIADLVVGTSIVLALAFVVAWLASPALRARIERPKHRFAADVAAYDRTARRGTGVSEGEQ